MNSHHEFIISGDIPLRHDQDSSTFHLYPIDSASPNYHGHESANDSAKR
jgi:hypothetical protein